MKFDLLIIGFGKGGKTLASEIANTGKKVALIEKSSLMYGGTCINVACIPTKSLVKSAKNAEKLKADSWAKKAELYRQAIVEIDRLTAALRQKNFDKLNNNPNITVYTGTPSFVSPTEVKVIADNSDTILKADKIVINTGSRPIIPGIPGIRENKLVYTSKTLMEVTKLPRRLGIIGAGRIGLEFASIYASFGSEVTVFNRGNNLFPDEDEDIVKAIRETFEKKGVRFFFGAQTSAINNLENETVIVYVDRKTNQANELVVDGILIATGRSPNIEGLNVSAAGIETIENGGIKVDKYLRTNVPNIWGLGDVTGGPQFTYTSLDDYRIVSPQVQGNPDGYNLAERKNIPYSLFIDPPFARVGINEKEARARNLEIKIARMPASAIPKAQVLNETDGLLKVIVDVPTGLILGAMLFCVESHEMINVVKLAMDAGLPYTVLRDQIYTHPTMTEGFNNLLSMV